MAGNLAKQGVVIIPDQQQNKYIVGVHGFHIQTYHAVSQKAAEFLNKTGYNKHDYEQLNNIPNECCQRCKQKKSNDENRIFTILEVSDITQVFLEIDKFRKYNQEVKNVVNKDMTKKSQKRNRRI